MQTLVKEHSVYISAKDECHITSSLGGELVLHLWYDFWEIVWESVISDLSPDVSWILEDIIKIDKMIWDYLQFVLYPEKIVSAFINEVNSRHYTEDEVSIIMRAFYDMRMAHKWVYRKHDKTPYYTHPLLASYIAMKSHGSSDDVVVQLLHDCIEDTDFGYKDILSAYWEDIARKVMYLSKKDKAWNMLHKDDLEYFSFLQKHDLLKDKFCDRFSNLLSLFYSPDDFKERYIKKTRKFISFLERDYYHLSIVLEITIDLIENVYKVSDEEQERIKYLKKVQK